MGGTTPPDPTQPTGEEKPNCPLKVLVTLPNPSGLNAGDKLEIVLEGATTSVLVLTTQSGVRLGVAQGVPALSKLIECLKDQVPYAAHVESVTPASLTCVIARL